MIGKVHSFETFGTVDGPGIRFVVFMQGCNFRCKFCHNPDTWIKDAGKEYTEDEIIELVEKYRVYYEKSGGGITATGGEPLLQIDFVTELFRKAKERGFNTALDTAGDIDISNSASKQKIDSLLEYTDLVLLDIKEIDEKKHIELTGKSNLNTLKLVEYLNVKNIPTVIRYVYIKGINDSKETLDSIKNMKNKFNNITYVDVLGYHKMGEYKWKKLGIKNEFENLEPPTKDEVNEVKKFLNSSR